MGIWIQVILVTVILAAMVMILLGIDHLFTDCFNADEKSASQLRDDVEHSGDVISDNSLFESLVSRTARHGSEIRRDIRK